MSTRYTQSFKQQAIEKALSRSDGTTLVQVTDSLGVGHSTLHKWMVKSRNQQLGLSSGNDSASIGGVKKEKRPQDWSQAERLEIMIASGALRKELTNPANPTSWLAMSSFGSSRQANRSGRTEMPTANIKATNGQDPW